MFELEKIASEIANDGRQGFELERIADALNGEGQGFEIERIAESVKGGGGSSEDVEMYKALTERTITFFSNSDLSFIGEYAFVGCMSLSSVNLPEVTEISQYAFMSLSKLMDVYTPKVTTIGACAFNYCSKLKNINLQEVTTIGNNAFRACEELVSVNLPKVTNISAYAFDDCPSLRSVYLMGSSVPVLEDKPWLQDIINNTFGSQASFYVAESMYDAFCSASYWSDVQSRIISVPVS